MAGEATRYTRIGHDRERNREAKTLLVLGAGPKALAIAAKHSVLRRRGYIVPNLVIVDRQGVAAHWSGSFGFTDGRRILGTLPEKDVGFPYASTCWGSADANAAIDAAMTAFSWPSYLIAEHTYSDWIDRGRSRPLHREWSEYLQWVATRIGMNIQRGEVQRIGRTADGERWQLACQSADTAPFTLEGDGLVITGPGAPITIPGQPQGHPRVLDGATVWRNMEEFALRHDPTSAPVNIGVIGTGETAAAIVVALLDVLADAAIIEVFTPHGVLYSRDEGFEENRVFSDPDANWASLSGKQKEAQQWSSLAESHKRTFRWSSLTEKDRREFVRRTDRGVFSVQAMNDITRARNVRSAVGAARGMRASPNCVLVEAEYGDKIYHAQYDYVVVARGFDPLWFTALFDEQSREQLHRATGKIDIAAVERTIGRDLTVDGFTPRLHLPMLAGVAQGPGFPNLSSLGLLADRVLYPYTIMPASTIQEHVQYDTARYAEKEELHER